MGENGSSDALGLSLPNPNADKASSQSGKSLEVLLAIKNKRILEELTKFRVRAVLTTSWYLTIWLHITDYARRTRSIVASSTGGPSAG